MAINTNDKQTRCKLTANDRNTLKKILSCDIDADDAFIFLFKKDPELINNLGMLFYKHDLINFCDEMVFDLNYCFKHFLNDPKDYAVCIDVGFNNQKLYELFDEKLDEIEGGDIFLVDNFFVNYVLEYMYNFDIERMIDEYVGFIDNNGDATKQIFQYYVLSKYPDMEEKNSIKNKNTLQDDKPKGHLYLIGNNIENKYKIGFTKSKPEKRISTIQTSCPFNLDLIFSSDLIIDYIKIEKELHEKYSDKRLKGEWFSLEYNDIIEIQNYLKCIQI